MTLRTWVRRLRRSPNLRGLLSRVDLPTPPSRTRTQDTTFEPSFAGTGFSALDSELPSAASGAGRAGQRGAEPSLSAAEHLGAYAPLIAAVRSELEHFIVSQLRLHLAIADRDRFVLTAIAVQCAADDHPARERLQQFMREFRPEQIKRYLAREVIAGLPNAAAIDLSQFGGLADARALAAADGEDDYAELLAALADPRTGGSTPAYEVSLLGRWSENDAAAAPLAAVPPAPAAGAPARGAAAVSSAPLTPLAGHRFEFDVEDGDGRRRIVLPAVLPGRRYVIGQGEGCDIVLRGTYTSRRHAELWHEDGRWWVGDAGSTNGIRVEGGTGQRDAAPAAPAGLAAGSAPLRLADGARLVLSARGDGPPSDYPRLALRAAGGASASAPATPIVQAVPRTPLTAIHAPAAAAGPAFGIAMATPSGATVVLALRADTLPASIGRSRHQALVIDRRHDGVSGHHLDVIALDADGVLLEVHGDNGVLLDGIRHAAGARLRWRAGQALVLGAVAGEPGCTLQLRRG
ncbi:FHA domain-containing protein [Aquabacterium humicola]|uniref:FHA domain-containing protein n=1 Tax=Aquabacterium humicola TaxID=3237377 RepID=UPI002543CDBF|nr:FHA domain-containing protein [Rubrivivax pictus]